LAFTCDVGSVGVTQAHAARRPIIPNVVTARKHRAMIELQRHMTAEPERSADIVARSEIHCPAPLRAGINCRLKRASVESLAIAFRAEIPNVADAVDGAGRTRWLRVTPAAARQARDSSCSQQSAQPEPFRHAIPHAVRP